MTNCQTSEKLKSGPETTRLAMSAAGIRNAQGVPVATESLLANLRKASVMTLTRLLSRPRTGGHPAVGLRWQGWCMVAGRGVGGGLPNLEHLADELPQPRGQEQRDQHDRQTVV